MIIYDPIITGSFQLNGNTLNSVGEIDTLSGSVSALNSASSSYLLNTTDTLTGNLTVTGTLTAQEFHTEYTSASIVYQSGSTKFGDSSDDVHQFTGSLSQTSGNVGIGTTTTNVAHIHEASTGIPNMRLTELNPGGAAQIVLENQTSTWELGSDASPNGFFIQQLGGSQDTFFIDSSGRVGIGTNNPTSTLYVKDDFSAGVAITLDRTENAVVDDKYYIGVSSAGATATDYMWLGTSATSFIVNGNGNVGIGTSNPSAHLHIVSTGDVTLKLEADSDNAGTEGDNPLILLSQDGGLYTANIGLNGNADDAFTGVPANAFYVNSKAEMSFGIDSTHVMQIDTNGYVGIGTNAPDTLLTLEKVLGDNTFINVLNKNTAVDIGQQKSFIDFTFVDSNINYTPQVRIGAEVGQNGDANSISKEGSGAFVVYTATGAEDGTGTLSEKFRVDHLGNVGIGTETPEVKLSLFQNASQGNPSNHTPANATLKIQDSSNQMYLDGNSIIQTGAASFTFGNTQDASILFYTNASEKVRFQSDGNVGIGTTSPSAILDVHAPSTTAPSLTMGAAAGQILKNEDLEFAFGLNNVSPYNGWIQTRFAGNTSRSLAINPLGGAVGIGTNSPGAKLDVIGVLRSYYAADNYGQIDNGALKLVGNHGGTFLIDADNAGSADLVNIKKSGSSRFYIQNGGNVGIGTTGPEQALHVVGNVKITNNGAAHLILDGDNNNSGDTGETDSIIDFMHDNEQYGYRMSVQNNAGAQTFKLANNNLGTYTNRLFIENGGSLLLGGHAENENTSATANGWTFTINGTATGVCNFSDANEMVVLNQRDGLGTTQFEFRNGNVERGRIEWTTSGTTYNTNSDYRLKENVANLTGSLSKIDQLEPKTFNFISDPDESKIGFIAHEVQEVVPQAVSGIKDAVREDGTPKYQGLDHSMLVPLLVGAIKELKAEIDSLKAQLNG